METNAGSFSGREVTVFFLAKNLFSKERFLAFCHYILSESQKVLLIIAKVLMHACRKNAHMTTLFFILILLSKLFGLFWSASVLTLCVLLSPLTPDQPSPRGLLSGRGAAAGAEAFGGVWHHLLRLPPNQWALPVPGQQQPVLLPGRCKQQFQRESKNSNISSQPRQWQQLYLSITSLHF